MLTFLKFTILIACPVTHCNHTLHVHTITQIPAKIFRNWTRPFGKALFQTLGGRERCTGWQQNTDL